MFTDVSDFLESENEIKTTMLASIPAETEILAYRFELETKIMGPNLQNILRRAQGLFSGTIHLQKP